jgi:hypothetical protein
MCELGFAHNNCGSTCVRAGQRQWKHLLEVLPERYEYAQEREEELRQLLGDVRILRKCRSGESRPLPLSLLREQ